MISAHEKDDLVHIMKMNRFVLSESDSAHLLFDGKVSGSDYRVGVLMIENQPQTTIEKDGKRIFNELIKSIDDLKIFLEERFYQFLEV